MDAMPTDSDVTMTASRAGSVAAGRAATGCGRILAASGGFGVAVATSAIGALAP